MVRTRNQRMGKIPQRGVTGSSSQYTSTGESSNPLCVEEESPPTVVIDPVPISKVPFGEPQEQSNVPPGNPNLPLVSHDEQPNCMPISADLGDNRIVDPNDLVVQLRFAINRGWEPDLSSYVSFEEEMNLREPEVEEHDEPQNQEANRPPSPQNEEHIIAIETIPISRVNKNPRKRKKSDQEKGKQKVVNNADMSNLPKPHSTTFLRKKSVNLWKRIVEKKIISQKLLIIDRLDNSEQIQEVLITNQLLGTVTNIEPYDEQVIQVFYCNLTKTTYIPSSPMYGKVYLRGNFYDFRPDTINSYLGTPETEQNMEINSEQVAQELTAGNVSFEKNKIKAASLTSKYAIFQKIALANWMPSLHESTVKWTFAELLYRIGKGVKINMGTIIHSQITNLTEDTKSNTSLIFPNLIFAILTKQGLKTHGPKISVKNINTTLKLRKGNHQNDLKNSAPKNNPLDPKTLLNYFEGRLSELEISEKQLLRKHMDIKEEKAEIIEWLAILKTENEEVHDQEGNQGSEEESQENVETPVSTPETEDRS
ncbi:PREDICTED: uncharacterized protein LOC109174386 [Ipomoea nil]|uniref:uncharacterized protein LOC109174386 n=1 Tax=Ipomoea nil TaxID=35883 RepID=UPI000901480A|nr:PREDICTED: uncharacterized protein LOC109174386 [Ipomoea nil]